MSFKRKLTSVKKLKKKNVAKIKAVAQTYIENDDEAEIKNALDRFKVEQKEEELLSKELQKPVNARNAALMNKYASKTNERLGGWPLDIGKNMYKITATHPDDPEITLVERPSKYFAYLTIPSNGSTYIFKFPIIKYSVRDNVQLYKLDLMSTVINEDGDIMEDLSPDVTAYTALKKYIDGDMSDVLDYFVNESYLEFKFPQFYVKYELIGKIHEEYKSDSDITDILNNTTPNETATNDSGYIDANDGNQYGVPAENIVWYHGGVKSINDKLKKYMENSFKNIGIPILSSVPHIDKNSNVIAAAYLSIANTKSKWFVYTDVDNDDSGPFVISTYVEGLEQLYIALKDQYPSTTKSMVKTVALANKKVREINKKTVEEYKKELQIFIAAKK